MKATARESVVAAATTIAGFENGSPSPGPRHPQGSLPPRRAQHAVHHPWRWRRGALQTAPPVAQRGCCCCCWRGWERGPELRPNACSEGGALRAPSSLEAGCSPAAPAGIAAPPTAWRVEEATDAMMEAEPLRSPLAAVAGPAPPAAVALEPACCPRRCSGASTPVSAAAAGRRDASAAIVSAPERRREEAAEAAPEGKLRSSSSSSAADPLRLLPSCPQAGSVAVMSEPPVAAH